MTYNYEKYQLLRESKVKVGENISLKNPSVLEVQTSKRYSVASNVFCLGTREVFSQFPEVDKLEQKYPTMRDLLVDEKEGGRMFLGEIFTGRKDVDGTIPVFEALSYWTGIEAGKFELLSNGKIICAELEWIIDADEWNSICAYVRECTCYIPNPDYIAPTNMTRTRHETWLKMYEGRRRKALRNTTSLADKMLVLSISANSYIPIEEIEKMTFYHFVKLSEALSVKEGYDLRWLLNTSQNFQPDTKIKSWKETFKL